jgi:hypothetical protein
VKAVGIANEQTRHTNNSDQMVKKGVRPVRRRGTRSSAIASPASKAYLRKYGVDVFSRRRNQYRWLANFGQLRHLLKYCQRDDPSKICNYFTTK